MWRLAFVVLLAFVWLQVSWGRLPSSGILVGYMRIHPMCFQSWVYWRGVQFRVAFFSIPFPPSPITGSFSQGLLGNFSSTEPGGLECDGCSGSGAW